MEKMQITENLIIKIVEKLNRDEEYKKVAKKIALRLITYLNAPMSPVQKAAGAVYLASHFLSIFKPLRFKSLTQKEMLYSAPAVRKGCRALIKLIPNKLWIDFEPSFFIRWMEEIGITKTSVDFSQHLKKGGEVDV